METTYLTKEQLLALPIDTEFVMRDINSGEESLCKRLKANDDESFVWEDLGYCDLVMMPGDEVFGIYLNDINEDGSFSPPDHPEIIHKTFLPPAKVEEKPEINHNKSFYPKGCEIDKERIVELINNELYYIEKIEANIQIDDPRLTDEFCQELVDAWWDDEGNLGGDLWEDEDTLEEEWSNKIINLFKPQ